MVKSESCYAMEEELSASDENKSTNELELLEDEAYESSWPADAKALQQRRRSCGELLLIQSAPTDGGGGQAQSGALSSCTSSSSGHESSSLLLLSPGAMTRSAGGGLVGGEDKRIRRQIANCNERRRMQSINAGFQSLRHMLPRKDGDKMSKAAILQQTAEFVHALLVEKERLSRENEELLTRAKRRRLDVPGDCDSMDTGESHLPAHDQQTLRTIDELRAALVGEQQLRLAYERQLVDLQARQQQQQQSAFAAPAPQHDGGFELLSATELAGYTAPVAGLVLAAGQSHHHHQQQPSILGSALSSAISTLRGVLGSRIGQTAESAAVPQQQQQSPSPPAPVAWPQQQHVQAQAATQLQRSQSGGEASISQRNLQAILDAIRHIEGGAFAGAADTNGELLSQ